MVSSSQSEESTDDEVQVELDIDERRPISFLVLPWPLDFSLLIAAIAVFVFAALFQIQNGDRVSLAGWTIPETCTSKAYLNLPCPGCGLTRSFVALAHGDWIASYSFHRLGWATALFVFLQIPYRTARLIHPNQSRPKASRYLQTFALVLVIAILVNWVVELVWFK